MTTALEKPTKEPELAAAERALARGEQSALLPVFSGTQMAQALTAYRELQRALDGSMPEQIMTISGRPFRKKGYWRAIRTAFNLNVECIREESDDYGWRVVYRATAPNGRFADGDGACENDEKAEGMDTDHNVRSHAHTRAFNRAVSNLVGFGEVSAEEVGRNGGATSVTVEGPRKELPPAPAGYHYFSGYKQSGEWHEFTINKFDAQGGAIRLSTKKSQVAAAAAEAYQSGTPVKVNITMRKAGEAYLNGIETLKGEPTSAAIDAEIVRQDEARRAGEVL